MYRHATCNGLITTLFALSAILFVPIPSFGFQTEEVEAAEAKAAEEVAETTEQATDAVDTKQEDQKTEPETPVVDTSAGKPQKVDDRFVQLHLRDGSIIGGKLKRDQIHVKTEFGTLTVPIGRIIQVFPGYDNQPDLKANVESLVKALGDSKLDVREGAQKKLLAMGPEIREMLAKFEDGGDAERSKRLKEIELEFEEMIMDAEEDTQSKNRFVIAGDTVVTKDFSIVGEIQEKSFDVTSKFGMLKVQLADIRMADRAISLEKPEVRKTVSVNATAFFQRKPVSTRIRVNKGDRIVIKADGIVQWTNWSTSSTPDGLTNRSQWNGINSGTLVARIGSDNSKCVKIGSEAEFVAKNSGTLYLGISMRDSYANNSSYNWTGNYKAKIVINSK